jgi:hypothetical protein
MSRIIKTKDLDKGRLATNYGGWMYCENCNTNIGYLCYVTYDQIQFSFTCTCGSKGHINIDFEDSTKANITTEPLIIQKRRLSCPKDQEPLITILEEKLKDYHLEIVCKSCHQKYTQQK